MPPQGLSGNRFGNSILTCQFLGNSTSAEVSLTFLNDRAVPIGEPKEPFLTTDDLDWMKSHGRT